MQWRVYGVPGFDAENNFSESKREKKIRNLQTKKNIFTQKIVPKKNLKFREAKTSDKCPFWCIIVTGCAYSKQGSLTIGRLVISKAMVAGMAWSKIKLNRIVSYHILIPSAFFSMPSSLGADCHPPGSNITSIASNPDGSNQKSVFGGGAESWIFLWRFEGHSRERKSCNPGFAFGAGGKVGTKISKTDPIVNSFPELFPKNLKEPAAIPIIGKESPELFPKLAKNSQSYSNKNLGKCRASYSFPRPHPMETFPRWEPFPCNPRDG